MQIRLRITVAAIGLTCGLILLGGWAYSTPDPSLEEAAASAEKLGPPRLIADLSDKILYVNYGDSIHAMYDIADGKDGYPTPRGIFRVRKLTWNPSWVPPDSKWARKKKATPPGHPQNPMKVVKIFFKEPDFYIHGTDLVGSLGYSGSHGCLRMRPTDVAEVGKWLMAHGGQPKEENWFLRILHSRREEKTVLLSRPVPIRIVD